MNLEGQAGGSREIGLEAVAVSRQEVMMVAWPEMVSLSLERSWIYLITRNMKKKNKKRGFSELEIL